MLSYDPDSERHRYTPEVHYRLYLGRDNTPTVICLQDHDYRDYSQHRLLSNKAFDNEGDAEEALRLLLADAAIVLGIITLP